MQHTSEEKGFITLVTVLIVGVVGVSIASSLILLGVDASRTSFAEERSARARALANTCAEDALERVRISPSYTGTATNIFPDGSCAYTIASQGGENRTIAASGTIDTIIRKSKISIDRINPTIRITSWQEVADF